MKNLVSLLLLLLLSNIGYSQIIQANYQSPLPDLQKQGWQIHSHSLSFDAHTIVFSAKAPHHSNYDLYSARKNGTSWQDVKALSTVNTSANELYPTLASSEQELIFVRHTIAEGKGKKYKENYFLMYSFQQDAKWVQPEVIIISEGNDISPLLMTDNKTVIFASSRTTEDKKDSHFALFYTQKIDQRNWYTPKLLLAPTDKNENYYAPYVKHFVKQSNMRSITIGYTRQICNHRDTSYIPEILVLPKQFHPSPVLTLEGRIRDVKTRRTIPAQINVYHAINFKPLAQIKSSSAGTYKIALPAGEPYFIDITGDNYSHYYCEYDCTSLETDTTIKANIDLDKQLNIRISSFDSEILLPINPDSILLNGKKIRTHSSNIDLELNIGELYDITYKKKGYKDSTLHINTQNSILLTQSGLDIELAPSKATMILQLVDADSLYNLSGIIDIRNQNKEEELTNQSPDVTRYTLQVRQGDTYLLYARAKGYIYKDTSFLIPYFSDTLIHTIPLAALRKKMVLQLRNIQFDYNSSALTPSSHIELDKLANLMQENPSMHIELSAHTDDVGSEQFNQRLSQQRGESAKKYLLRKGVAPERIEAKGYGKSKPLVPNDSEENRAINRRVEFTINDIQL